MQAQPATSKVVRLEAARGLAAFVVFVGHFLLAFQPDVLDGFVGEPYFFALNASAAVIFFFALSGYVLAVKPLQTQSLLDLRQALIRRWPRLIPLSLMSVMLSWLIYVFGGYYFPEAGAMSGSSFYQDWEIYREDPSFFDAFLQGSVMVFFSTENYLNRNLWTMAKELQGSVFVFLLCALFIVRKSRPWVLWVLVLALAAGTSRALLPFTLGFMIAWWQQSRSIEFAAPWRTLLFVSGLYLLGFREPVGAYEWLVGCAGVLGISEKLMFRLPAPLGSVLLLLALLSGPVFKWLDGHIGRKLGEFSFPLYVIHVIVMLSFSGWHYLTFGEVWLWLNFLITTLIVLVLCYPMAIADIRWVGWLKRKTTRKA